MKNPSDRDEAARNKVMPAAEDFVQLAADRVGPLTQSAAERVGPLAEAAAERFGAAADRVGPLAQSAAGRVTPLAAAAAATVAPFAHQAAEAVSPYAHQAAERLTPWAESAKQRGAQVAHDAVERFGPTLDDAFDRVGPAVDAAREKVSEELLPRLTAALSAAAASPVVSEAVNRGQATIAAARGDLVLPQKKKGGWVKRFAVVAAIAAVAYVVARRFLGSKDSDWQAARPTTPYTPPTPAATPTETPTADVSAADVAAGTTDAEAGDDPQGGQTTHSENVDANGAAEPDQPAEGGEAEAQTSTEPTGGLPSDDSVALVNDEAVEEPADVTTDGTVELPLHESSDVTAEPVEVVAEEPVEAAGDQTEPVETAGAEDPQRYSGEGVYVGSEPPEGFFIKGNERSMKYHLPDSAGYVRTIAGVWFSSEEAAEAAGFVRAQR